MGALVGLDIPIDDGLWLGQCFAESLKQSHHFFSESLSLYAEKCSSIEIVDLDRKKECEFLRGDSFVEVDEFL